MIQKCNIIMNETKFAFGGTATFKFRKCMHLDKRMTMTHAEENDSRQMKIYVQKHWLKFETVRATEWMGRMANEL